MKSPRIALTGATGFIGPHLIERLLADGFTINALTRQSRDPRAGVTWIEGDLADEPALALLVADTDLVIHLAGAVRGATRAAFDAVNVAGARNLGRAAAQAGVARLLSVSTLAAREPGLSHYTGSKHDGEAVLRQFFDDATVLRPPAVYGPGDEELKPLFDLMRLGIGPMPAHKGRLSLIYITDLVDALVAWVRSDIRGGTFEIHDGTANGYSWKELRQTIGQVCGRRSVPLPIPRALLALVASINVGLARLLRYAPMISPGKVAELFHTDWVVSETAFEAATGWRPRVDLRSGISELYRSN